MSNEITPPDQIEALPHPPITITITYHRGNVAVNAPMDDEIFCYGMLQMAKNAVMRYKDAQRAMQQKQEKPRESPSGLWLPGRGPQG